jgi:coenzyme F420 hydrogenase subunit delta
LTETINALPEYCRKAIVILGCGSVLFGDDGFGPAVVSYLLSHYRIPEDMAVVDAGTGVREILMDLALSEEKPKRLILVDVMEAGKPPGTITILTPDSLPQSKIASFSPHQAPTSLLLRELEKSGGVEVALLTAQPQPLPQEVSIGLSSELQDAVPRACELIASQCRLFES